MIFEQIVRWSAESWGIGFKSYAILSSPFASLLRHIIFALKKLFALQFNILALFIHKLERMRGLEIENRVHSKSPAMRINTQINLMLK